MYLTLSMEQPVLITSLISLAPNCQWLRERNPLSKARFFSSRLHEVSRVIRKTSIFTPTVTSSPLQADDVMQFRAQVRLHFSA